MVNVSLAENDSSSIGNVFYIDASVSRVKLKLIQVYVLRCKKKDARFDVHL